MNNSSYENDNRTFINDGTIINLKGTEYRILVIERQRCKLCCISCRELL